MTPSTSRSLNAACPASKTRSFSFDVIVLTPLLGEAFSGSTSLVDVRVGRRAHSKPSLPLVDERAPLPDFASAAQWMTPHHVDGEQDFAAEVSELLNLNLETLKVATELFHESANRRNALEGLAPLHLPHRVSGKEPHGSVEIRTTVG